MLNITCNAEKTLAPAAAETPLALKPSVKNIEFDWPSQVIAVTGTIGSGKSTFLEELKKLGAFVVSADQLVHELYASGKLTKSLVMIFGESAINADGSVNRKFIGTAVFSRIEKKQELEALVHPLVHEMAGERFLLAYQSGKRRLVYEVPLLFECGLERLGFKKIAVITAAEEQCVKRIVARSQGTLSAEEALKRIKAQMPASLKAAKADVVVDNSGTLEDLTVHARALIEGAPQC